MNQSKKGDPLRFLKKMKSRTPSKKSLQSSRTDVNMSEPSGMVQSKLQETILLKQNCYDADKYYSSKCQKYLKEIGYKQRLSPQQKIIKKENQSWQVQKVKTIQSNVNESIKSFQQESLENIMSKKKDVFMMVPPEGRELTFKKIDFSDKSQTLVVKENQRNLEVEIDQFEENILDGDEGAAMLKSCEVCGRKFKQQSYVKHVSICEKVFFKKRKQFSSQKQRSQSKEKKNQQNRS